MVENFLMHALFFIAEIMVIPPILFWRDGKRWAPMRAEIVNELINCYEGTMESLRLDTDHIENLYDDAKKGNFEIIQPSSLLNAVNTLEVLQNKLKSNIGFLSSAVEPHMGQAIRDLIHLPDDIRPSFETVGENIISLIFPGQEDLDYYKFGHSKRHENAHSALHKLNLSLDSALSTLYDVIKRSSLQREERNKSFDRLNILSNDSWFSIRRLRDVIAVMEHYPVSRRAIASPSPE